MCTLYYVSITIINKALKRNISKYEQIDHRYVDYSVFVSQSFFYYVLYSL